MSVPRIIIASPESGAGKTTITTGLIGAFKRKGLRVQPFKVGPDYIDPSYHAAVSGIPSRNLDTWMIDTDRLTQLFWNSASKADISIIEGVMGLFDGFSGLDETGSTAHVAKLLRTPVILIIDAWGMARTAAAIVKGCSELDRDVRVGGVILNRVSGRKHADWCREAIESNLRIPVVGYLEKNDSLTMPERHLGLIPTTEKREVAGSLSRIVDYVERQLDIQRIKQMADEAPLVEGKKQSPQPIEKNVKIGVAMDEAFCFYYRDALDLLEANGAELVPFSPIHDDVVPNVDGIYVGGGFPEVMAKDLAANSRMRSGTKKLAETGLPIFAECGGLMYLTKSIRDFEGNRNEMVGLLDGETVMTRGLTLSYTESTVLRDNILSRAGQRIRGHEFHYSKIENIPRDARFAYQMTRGVGIDGKHDGWLEYAVLAPYSHLHLASDDRLAMNFVRACEEYGRR